MNAIILHGKPSRRTYNDPELPSASNDIWLPWLQKQLLLQAVPTQTPEMINAWQPDYRAWKREFERHEVTPDTLLIGHSIGAGFLMQWLSERTDVQVGNIFLVAPSFGDRFTPDDPMDVKLLGGMGNFEIDRSLTRRVQSLTLLNSDNDRPRVQATVQYIRESLPNVDYHEFHGYGHFRGKLDMPHGNAFPELLALILTALSPTDTSR